MEISPHAQGAELTVTSLHTDSGKERFFEQVEAFNKNTDYDKRKNLVVALVNEKKAPHSFPSEMTTSQIGNSQLAKSTALVPKSEPTSYELRLKQREAFWKALRYGHANRYAIGIAQASSLLPVGMGIYFLTQTVSVNDPGPAPAMAWIEYSNGDKKLKAITDLSPQTRKNLLPYFVKVVKSRNDKAHNQMITETGWCNIGIGAVSIGLFWAPILQIIGVLGASAVTTAISVSYKRSQTPTEIWAAEGLGLAESELAKPLHDQGFHGARVDLLNYIESTIE
jgi:hypothetical protein